GSFERHDWRALAHALDEAAYAEQFAFLREGGRTPEAAVSQVLEETFGLGTVGNEVYPPVLDRDARPFVGLDRVREVTLEGAEPMGEGQWKVEGRVRLDDRTSRRLSFTVTHTGGTHRVAVPQG
ncbi:MAG TPA: hypothetical protein VD838_22420, partial [Anaeromyxobacteraceae bacterium]|nr:hypothetical protein [Anaeromyxobacteraceae bacterium]